MYSDAADCSKKHGGTMVRFNDIDINDLQRVTYLTRRARMKDGKSSRRIFFWFSITAFVVYHYPSLWLRRRVGILLICELNYWKCHSLHLVINSKVQHKQLLLLQHDHRQNCHVEMQYKKLSFRREAARCFMSLSISRSHSSHSMPFTMTPLSRAL